MQQLSYPEWQAYMKEGKGKGQLGHQSGEYVPYITLSGAPNDGFLLHVNTL